MENRMYLGNLPWATTSDDLAEILKDEGYDIVRAKVITDRETGKSRGFAFVDFPTQEAATEAIAGIDGYMLDGRPLRASEDEERPGRLETEQVTFLHHVFGRKRQQRATIPYVVYRQTYNDSTYGWNWENEQGETAVPVGNIGYRTKKKAIESAVSHFSTGKYPLPY